MDDGTEFVSHHWKNIVTNTNKLSHVGFTEQLTKYLDFSDPFANVLDDGGIKYNTCLDLEDHMEAAGSSKACVKRKLLLWNNIAFSCGL